MVQYLPIVWLEFAAWERPVVKRCLTERHDLRTPYIAESTEGTGDYRKIHLWIYSNAIQLTEVPEGKIRSVGAFLRDASSRARHRLYIQQSDIICVPVRRLRFGQSQKSTIAMRIEAASDIEYGDLLRRVLGKRKYGASGGWARSDNYDTRHG
jgi:hypothetical protein